MISTGATFDDEVRHAANIMKGHDFALLHCVTIYPTPLDQTNVKRLALLKGRAVPEGETVITFLPYSHIIGKLESLATGQKGVKKAYAIQAGREIRVIVRQEDITDAESFQLSRELAKKIEQELTYPGQIKVTVIRESRYVEYAR